MCHSGGEQGQLPRQVQVNSKDKSYHSKKQDNDTEATSGSDSTKSSTSNDDNSDNSTSSSEDSLEGVPEIDLTKIFGTERPHIIGDEESSFLDDGTLFDLDDQDVEMASRHSQPSSAAGDLPPPLTDSDGLSGADKLAEDEDDELYHLKLMMDKQKKKSQGKGNAKKSRRQAREEDGEDAEASEVPDIEVKAKPTKKKSASTAFDIVPPPPGVKDVRLNDQHDTVQAIIWAEIAQATKDVFLRDSWVKANERMTYRTNLIKDACDKVKKQYPGAKEVRKHVKDDEKYAKELSKLVSRSYSLTSILTDTMSDAQSPFERSFSLVKVAGAHQLPVFKLGKDPECLAHVKSLTKERLYIFPGTWGGEDNNIRTCSPLKHSMAMSNTMCLDMGSKGRQRISNEAISDGLKESFFANPRAIGFQYLSDYVSSLEGHMEKELPISMIALYATGTGVYCQASLREMSFNWSIAIIAACWSSGRRTNLNVSKLYDSVVWFSLMLVIRARTKARYQLLEKALQVGPGTTFKLRTWLPSKIIPVHTLVLAYLVVLTYLQA
ncbi:uncharacterized protein LACBIDRAFT_325444 [Laccaria bicolor S238N-H82]|uniref:Predicted protein n=1 Tax=Laccaria bicolor (strain S238N-H82 / ATCC MYA-4686) TaxID=486041 RepID=B0D4Y5_LACBS|nr:uncharacterized protein LACBIDRAFT_325444 [Laccaria bicolor S238N-H82]EDR10422.1 predicted protein [Laccaria bicolor S238N-H82]|eukprot:XP_001878872.1 predicted protein [Laccaria bicolor S238N-H82]